MMENQQTLGLGAYLKAEREKRNITIEQVASATKINLKLLHALESDNYETLPAKPFIRGFVTSYTRYVGLDYRQTLERFEDFLNEKSGQKFKRPENAPHIFVEKEGQSDNSKTQLTAFMVGFLVLCVIAGVILKPSLKHHRHKDKAAVSNEEVMTVAPPPNEGSPITVITKPATPAIPEPTAPSAPHPTAPTTAATPVVPTPPPTASISTTTPKPPATTSTPEKPKQPAPPVAGKLPPIPNNEVKQRLIARAVEDAWVKYQVDDRPLQAYLLRKDKVIFVRARRSIRFTTANPKGIELSFDNKEFHPFPSGVKIMILPKEAESEFKDQPFIAPNPAYLSTPNP